MADDAGPAGGVSVMLRIRPRNAKEQEGDDCWSWSDDAIVEVGPSGNKRYAYDRCFAPGVGNKEVYECDGCHGLYCADCLAKFAIESDECGAGGVYDPEEKKTTREWSASTGCIACPFCTHPYD